MADAYVVDTGVFLRWFIDQDGFEHAREIQQRLVDGSLGVATVDFARVEVAGVLRKKDLLARYDALFVELAEELDLPLLTTDSRLRRAVGGSARIEVLQGIEEPSPA